MDDAPAEVRDRVEDLERRIAREHEEADRGRRAAIDADARIGSRERRLVMAVLAVTVLGVAVSSRPVENSIDPIAPLRLAIAPVLGFALMVAILRRRLLGNAFTRRSVALLGLMLGMVVIHRVVAWQANQSPNQTFTAEMLMVAGACGAAGIMQARSWYVSFAAGLIGALIATLNPAWASSVFRVVVLLLVAVAVIFSARDANRVMDSSSPGSTGASP
jgi:hypothetical protein